MSKKHLWIICSLIVLFWSIVITAIAVVLNNTRWDDFLSSMAVAFYIPHYNSFGIGIAGNYDAYFYVYLILLLSTLSAYILKVTFWRSHKGPSLSGLLRNIVWAIFLITLALQTIGQAQYYMDGIRWDRGKVILKDRYPAILKNITSFAEFCKKTLPDHKSCEIKSAPDLPEDPWILWQRFLAYQLYPIDTFGVRQDKNPSSCLIILAPQDPVSLVPPGYDIIGRWASQGLVAVQHSGAP